MGRGDGDLRGKVPSSPLENEVFKTFFLAGIWPTIVRKFRIIVAAVAGSVVCVVFGLVVQHARLVGVVGKFRIIVAAVASFFVCIVFGSMVQRLCGCVGKFRIDAGGCIDSVV